MWGTRSLFPPQSGTGCPLCPLQPPGPPLPVGQHGRMVGKAPTQRRVPSAPPARAESCFFCSLRRLITARTTNTPAWVAGAPMAGLGEPAGGGTPIQGSLSSATTQKRSMSQIPRVRASSELPPPRAGSWASPSRGRWARIAVGNTGWSAWGPRTAPSGSLGTAPGCHVPDQSGVLQPVPTSVLGVTAKRPWGGGCPHQPGPTGSGARDGTSRQGMAKHGTARQGWARHIARCDGKGGTGGGGRGCESPPHTPCLPLHPGLCLLWMLGAIKPGLWRGRGPPPAAGTWRAHACVCTREDGSCGRARGSCASTRGHVTCPRALHGRLQGRSGRASGGCACKGAARAGRSPTCVCNREPCPRRGQA